MKSSIIRHTMAIVALLMALFHSVTASAADTWSVNPSDYRYDMSLYLNVSFANGEKLDYTQYDVAAFVGDECRGVAEVLPLPGGADCLYLRARSNSERGETMTFRYRNKSTGEVKVVEKVDFAFSSNGSLGMPSSPYEVKIVFYHDVTITAGEGGTVNEKGGRLAEGTTFYLLATPAEGHHFVQWSDGSTDNPRHLIVGTEDITLTAEFALSSYRLTYTLDGVSFKETDVLYGTALTAEPNPEKEGYTFSGWQGLPETMPAHDVEVTGTFSINSYKAVFKIGDDVIDTKTIVYGEAVTAPEAPAKEGYTFAGWQNMPETMPAHDIEVVGSYTVNKYALTYKVDGEEYKKVEVDFGTTLTPEPNPVKEGYIFSGWQGLPETMPAHDVEVIGSYTANKYALTYKVDGEEYKKVEVDFGTTLTPEPNPVKEGYTFSGWEGLPETMPAHDVEVTGTFSINSYRLTVYLDGKLYKDETLEYGTPIDLPDPEVVEGRVFSGWDITVPETMPAHDVEIHGTTTIIDGLEAIFANSDTRVTIYSINGVLLFHNTTVKEAAQHLKSGIYIVNGRKMVVK